ncbi:MAG: hypothetical protein ACLFT3_15545 [Cyclobacteriaceae bacterium]
MQGLVVVDSSAEGVAFCQIRAVVVVQDIRCAVFAALAGTQPRAQVSLPLHSAGINTLHRGLPGW